MEATCAEVKDVAKRIRLKMFENMIRDRVYHIGGDLSCVEMLVFLFYRKLQGIDLKDEDRDCVIMSKAHNIYTLYTILLDKGYLKADELKTYGCINSALQGHPDCKRLKILDFSGGALGQGLSVGIGMALANRIHNKLHDVFVVLGDGELEEGQNWEAAMSGAKYQLDNLYAFVDFNKLQVDGVSTPLVGNSEIMVERWSAFGWNAVLIEDGNDIDEIEEKFDAARQIKGKPTIFIANTVKGKGISFMENAKEWHSHIMDEATINKCIKELGYGVV